MATTYVDPGSYIERKIVPGSVSVSSDRNLAIVGIAPRTRRVSDEAIIRGKVYEEGVTFSGSSPYLASLTNVSDRNRNNAVLYMNGNALAIGDWNFEPAKLEGNSVAGTLDTTVKYKFTMSVDKKVPITIDLTAGATTALSAIVSDINAALLADSNYGAAYATVASLDTDKLVLTSPLTTSSSDVKVFLSLEDSGTYEDAASLVSNAAWVPTATAGVQGATVVKISDAAYVDTATYTIDYVTVNTVVDALEAATASSPLSSIVSAGPYPGGSSYVKATDYEETGNTIDWVTSLSANAALVGVDGTYNIVGTNNTLLFSINGGAQLTVTLTSGATQSASAVAADINLALNGSANYGPLYAHCAYVVGSAVALRAPAPFVNYPTDKGESSVLVFYSVANDAFTTLFGIPAASQPYETRGTGNRPTFGTTYYASYDHTRDADDYTSYHRVYDVEGLYDYCSPLTLGNYIRNQLCIAGELAFANLASSVYLVQVNDSTAPGSPTSAQIRAAIDVCGLTAGITEICVLDTSLDTAVYVQNHVSTMSSLLEKKPRRGWYGMARGTEIGDPDTPDTLLYRSKVTLQPGPTSPGRGRQILVAPTEVERTLTLDDGREVTVELDGTYLACAAGAYFSALPNPSNAMVGAELTGFNIEGFETYLDGERHTLADGGCLVVTMAGGRALMLDPLTTEAGGGKDVGLEEPQSTAADDAVTRTVNNTLDKNVKGVVPDDLADFISDIKSWLKGALEACIEAKYIGPYRNADNTARALDPSTDIQVVQSASDARTFRFKYWYNRKYPAKRFFGEYSTDNPFFTAAE